jgi:class 3 adenylate cyclase/tetratricopeptide (TPR) repeat protein
VANGRPETVTVLFTDLVGSTAWRTRAGDAAADTRIAELERASREVVESAGGNVVKGVGDGVMATFTSAVVAVDVAAALQGVARRLGVGGSRACLRVGVSTGELVREGDDWLGAAAIEASRLCAEATGGAVLVADVTARLSRGRTEHTMRSVGERTLRGFDSPVEVFELVVASSEAVPVPPPLVRAAESPMVGRQAERRHMGKLLAGVQAGESETLLVVGEPGVGKTRLVAALASNAAERGFIVMFGRCDEVVTAPYKPIVEALAPWLVHLPTATLERIVGSGRDSLRLLWPEIVGGPIRAPVDPETERWRLFDAITALVTSIAEDSPLLVIVDDLQWAEPSTRLLLSHLARAATPRLALVSTARRTMSGTDGLGLLSEGRTIELRGLSPPEIRELVTRHVGAEPPSELSSALCRQTDGNPFFLDALLAHLDDVAFVQGDDGEWLTAGELEAAGVPPGIRAVVARRLDSLGRPSSRVLEIAATCGLTFEERIVTAVNGETIDVSIDAFDSAVSAGLIREEGAGTYAFVHALVRQTVLDNLSRTRVARLHWRVAEELERHLTLDHGPDAARRLSEIAYHYAVGADVGDTATVARTSRDAGEDALHRLAFEEAVAHLRTGLDALDSRPDDEMRYGVLMSLGHALNALGEAEQSRPVWMEAIGVARQQRNAEWLFGALLGYRYMNRTTVDVDLVKLIDEVLDLLGPGDSPTRALASAMRSAPGLRNDLGRVPQADVRLADEAVAMAVRTGDRTARVSTLRARLSLRSQYPDAEATRRDAEELVRLDPCGFDVISRDSAAVLRELTRAFLRVGRRADAERYLAQAEAEAERNGLPMSGVNNLVIKSALATASGRFGDAQRLTSKLSEQTGLDLTLTPLLVGAQTTVQQMEQGRVDEVIATMQHLKVSPATHGWTAMVAAALADVGRADEASDALHRLADDYTAGGQNDYATALVMRYLPEVCRHLDDSDAASTLLPLVRAWSGQLLVVAIGVSIEGAADRSLGHLLATLGRLDAADDAYRAAAELEHSANFPPLVARTQYWHARTLLERDASGDRERAAALLSGTIEIAAQLGMTLLHRRSSELLSRV